MAIDLINIGNIANDGTGDDLREAFFKINQNLEELDLRIPEEITASNLGVAEAQGVFLRKVGPELQFKKIKADTSGRVVVSSDADHVLLDIIGGRINFETDIGAYTVTDTLDNTNVKIKGFVNPDDGTKSTQVIMLPGDDTIYIKSNSRLKDELSPKLNATLDAQNNNIINVNETRSTRFVGDLRGTVYGIDVRTLGTITTVFDFGFFNKQYSNPIQFLIDQSDIDLGSFLSPADLDLELGII